MESGPLLCKNAEGGASQEEASTASNKSYILMRDMHTCISYMLLCYMWLEREKDGPGKQGESNWSCVGFEHPPPPPERVGRSAYRTCRCGQTSE